MPNYKSDVFQAPGQVTSPDSASKPFITDKDGVIYPVETTRPATTFIAGEGSMGFERNQAVTRESLTPPDPQAGMMGQSKLQRLKSGGSHAI